MYKKKKIEEEVYKIISNVLKISKNKLNKKTSMLNTSEWDSLANLNIYAKLEKKYSINLEKAYRARTIEDWIKVVKK
tara:strand:+ start:448 stop:678 length:231 start_codon:yes stop_codon:yes gene_type:complete